MDDYHKHIAAQKPLFEFLGQLQILKDNLTRGDLKIGFIVSGLPAWEKSLPKNPQLSGFLDGPILRMPNITPQAVADVFNQRIAAYCVDKHARTIRREFVEHIFAETDNSTGYREYLNSIIEELERNNFAIVDTPIDITPDELEDIRSILERSPEIRSSLTKLIHESSFKRFTGSQVNKCLELLVQVGLRDGVSELDNLFRQNSFYFGRLKDVALIQKRKSAAGRTFVWVVTKRLSNAIEEVETKHKKSVGDYFLKIYGTAKQKVVRADPRQAAKAGPLKDILTLDLSTAALKTLQQASGLIDSLDIEQPNVQQLREMVNRAALAMEALFKAIFQLENSLSYFEAAEIADLDQRLSVHWVSNELVGEARRRLQNIRGGASKSDLQAAFKQCEHTCEELVLKPARLNSETLKES